MLVPRVTSARSISTMCMPRSPASADAWRPVLWLPALPPRSWFTGPVFYGDTVTVSVWISAKDEINRTMDWKAVATKQDGTEVLQAEATLKFPRSAMRP